MSDYRNIPETVVPGKRLGRHQQFDDPRDFGYLASVATNLINVKHEAVGLPLDQGNVGSCTANALCGALNSQPNNKGKVYTETDALNLYTRETMDEGAPYPEYDPGGTGRAVCKAARELSMITSWQNALGLQAALAALVVRPVILGVNWYSSFDEPDAEGQVYVRTGAYVRGGHEIVADELDVDNYRIGLWNSWGTSYGIGGRFYMSWHCLWRLLTEGGTVTVPIP